MALGGAGGCIPLYVLYTANSPHGRRWSRILRDLPHVRWLDYCEIATVSHHAARTNISRVVEILADVTAEQAEAKTRAPRRAPRLRLPTQLVVRASVGGRVPSL